MAGIAIIRHFNLRIQHITHTRIVDLNQVDDTASNAEKPSTPVDPVTEKDSLVRERHSGAGGPIRTLSIVPKSISVMQPGPRLDSFVSGRDNNFNLIRMLAALGVLISHAYPLSLGSRAEQPLAAVLGVTLGTVSVMVFFGISGFLVARSFERSSTIRRFLIARVLRLFPALLMVLIVTVGVSALWLNQASPEAFWRAVPSYIVRNFTLYFPRYDLPGVFVTNPYGSAINGSLWTLNHEITCYLGIMALGFLGALASRRRMTAMLVLFVAGYFVILILDPHPRLVALARLAWPFWIGTALYVWRDQIEISLRMGFLLVGMAVAAYFTSLFVEIFAIALVYLVFLCGYLPRGTIRAYNLLGDYSYGTYIYAFPVQQLLSNKMSPMTPLENMTMSIPIVLFCAVLSWSFVEKPSLSIVR